MTKSDLVDQVFVSCGGTVTKKVVDEIIGGAFNQMKKAFKQGEEIRLSDFGIFKVVQKKARVGRNPQTNEPVNIPAKKAVTFKASKFVKDLLN
jgi:nucleoid DNA-binding protein